MIYKPKTVAKTVAIKEQGTLNGKPEFPLCTLGYQEVSMATVVFVKTVKTHYDNERH